MQQIAGQGADALAAHRVALVGHGGGADLLLAEGLLDLAAVRQEPDVDRELGRRGRQPGQRVQHQAVPLARVGLAADGDGAGESHALGDHAVELAHLVMVAVEELQEAGLGAGGALDAAERQAVEQRLDLLEVEQEVLQPQRRALAEGGRLGRLEVGEAQDRLVALLAAEVVQGPRDADDPRPHDPQAFLDQDQVGAVGDVAGGRPQVQDSLGGGRLLAEGVDVGHDVVAQLPLQLGHPLQIEVLAGVLQGLQLLLADLEAEFALALGEGDPEVAPDQGPAPGGEVLLHHLAGVAGGQGRGVAGVGIAHRVQRGRGFRAGRRAAGSRGRQSRPTPTRTRRRRRLPGAAGRGASTGGCAPPRPPAAG